MSANQLKNIFSLININLSACKEGMAIILSILTVMTAGVLISCPVFGSVKGTPQVKTFPESLGWKFQYDDQGRLASIKDPSGSARTFRYVDTGKDGKDRRIEQKFSDGTRLIYEINQWGLLTHMTDSSGSVSYNYDDFGRLTGVHRKGSLAIAFEYDSLDRITLLQVGEFYRIEYSYDFLGRLASMSTPVGIISYEYQTGQNLVIRSFPNGVKTFWKYQPNGQLEEITHGFFKNPDDRSFKVIAQYEYSYEASGRIAAIRERTEQQEFIREYKYDSLGRLIKAAGPGNRTYEYEYDLVGNRTRAISNDQPAQVSTYDWAGRLNAINNKLARFDANANLIEVTLNGKPQKYRYHPDGRLAEVRAGSEAVQYGYDGFGRLISRKAAAGEWHFTPDPFSSFWQPLVIEEPGKARTLVIWDGPTPLALVRGGSVQWLLHDHLGSVRLETDAKGGVVRYREYDPFGVPEEKGIKEALTPGFTGLFRDEILDGYLTLARAFVPEIGSFLQPDPQKRIPAAALEDVALYAYCSGDPVNWIDRDGAERISAHFRFDQLAEQQVIAPRLSDSDWNDIMKQPTYNRRIEAYIEKWKKIHGTGPVAIMFLGIHCRPQDTELLAERSFPGQRVIVLWSYEGPFRKLDAIRTIIDRGNPVRNIDVSHILDFTSSLGLETQYMIFESGASHTFQKNANNIIQRSKDGKYNPEFIVTSASSGDKRKLKAMSFLGIVVHNVTDIKGDAVYNLTDSPFNRPNPIPIPVVRESTQLLQSFVYKVVSASMIPIGIALGEEQEYIKGLRGHAGEEHHKEINRMLVGVERRHRYQDMLETKYFRPLPEVNYDFLGPNKQPGPGPQSKALHQNLADHAMKSYLIAQEILSKHDIGGGDGRMAGPVGFASPGAYAALDEFRGRTTLATSPVGGVYLGGAGGALDGLGMVKGLRLDDNGHLVLIGEDVGEVKLPPLRLDDLVTVFRSVYLHGEGPTVTIDPNPENPEKSAMIIVHSAATRDTYVGWVLYEADRLMKGYTQGVDNKTQQDVVSRVPGYADVLETIYFGSDDPRKSQQEGIWERFWILPAAANRFEGPLRELTLFDVPLEVKTQRMKWEHNKLVDDLTGRSSPGAQAFTSWFTNNYDGIAAEHYLVPPPEYGISEPVPVFAELRRFALITAVAEKLRDQGVPMPFWMRDHEVRKVPCEGFTPGLEVTRQRPEGASIRTARIFGGVQLSAESRLVRTYATAADVAEAPPEEPSEMDRIFKLAGTLEQAVEAAVSPVGSPPLTVHSFTDDHRTYQAAALPGAATQALGPCRLAEADLVMPFAGGRDIRLVRRFNSFFDPQGPWGRGWTMDLPRLQEIPIQVIRKEGKTTYKMGHELITPLNSFYSRFVELRPIKELGGTQLMAPKGDGPFHGLANARPDFLQDLETRVLYLKDGQEWHFTPYGDLVAVKEGPQVTGYERRADGHVSRIVGLLGGRQAAQIDLEYDNQGILTKAVGRSFDSPGQEAVEVTYAYTPSGRFSGATFGDGTVGYEYKDSMVTAVTWTDKAADAKSEKLTAFEYNERGRLVSEQRGESAVRYTIAEVPGGVEASATHAPGEGDQGFVRYDLQMRPVEAREGDGIHTAWEYRPDGSIETTVTIPGDGEVKVTVSANGRQRTVRGDGSPTLVAHLDSGGRLTSLSRNEQVLLTQEWRTDGQPARTETETQGVSPQYDEHGLLSSILVHPPGAGQQPAEWQETRVDWRGIPLEVKDHTGLHLQLGYDASGALAGVVQKTPEGNMGYRIERDGEGRVQTIASSWGNLSYDYTAGGDLQRIESTRGGHSASLELADGLVRKVTGFDGGVTTFDYDRRYGLAGAPRGVNCANGLKLAYEYDPEGKLRAVEVGDERRVRLGYDDQGRVTSYALQARP